MTRPIAPNEEARQVCRGRLAFLGDQLKRKGVDLTLADLDAARTEAYRAVGKMLSHMDMDDICEGLDLIFQGND